MGQKNKRKKKKTNYAKPVKKEQALKVQSSEMEIDEMLDEISQQVTTVKPESKVKEPVQQIVEEVLHQVELALEPEEQTEIIGVEQKIVKSSESQVSQPIISTPQPVKQVSQQVANMQQPINQVPSQTIPVQQLVRPMQQQVVTVQQPINQVPQQMMSVQQPVNQIPPQMVSVQQPVSQVPPQMMSVQQPLSQMPQQVVSMQQAVRQIPPQMVSVQQPLSQVPQQMMSVQQPISQVPQQMMSVQQPVSQVPPQVVSTEQSVRTITSQTVAAQPSTNQMPQQVAQQSVNEVPKQVEIVQQSVSSKVLKEEKEEPQIIETEKEKKEEKLPDRKTNLLITNSPKSSFSEAIKSIRTNLQFAAVDKEIKVILVTSPEPGDGKSLISCNLAGAYAQENKKVLIIDCDLRKGRQAEIFGVKKSKTTGYTNMILNYIESVETGSSGESFANMHRELKDYIVKTDINNVDLIPNGPTPPNPIELLASDKNKELLQVLRKLYDVIILDCPPVLGLSDTLIMTKYSDANIVAISKGKTKLELLSEVKKSFEKVNSTITGVVVNKAKQTHNSYYGYYGDH